MLLNTLPQVGAYRSYAPSLLHKYLTGEGLPKKFRQRRFDVEGPTEKAHLRMLIGEGLTKKMAVGK